MILVESPEVELCRGAGRVHNFVVERRDLTGLVLFCRRCASLALFGTAEWVFSMTDGDDAGRDAAAKEEDPDDGDPESRRGLVH